MNESQRSIVIDGMDTNEIYWISVKDIKHLENERYYWVKMWDRKPEVAQCWFTNGEPNFWMTGDDNRCSLNILEKQGDAKICPIPLTPPRDETI